MRSLNQWRRGGGTLLLLTAFVCLAGMLATLPQPAHAQQTQDKLNYVLGPGDLIQIKVLGEDDLTIKTRIERDGYLSYPFLGDIKVAGKTVGQLQRTITQGLKGGYLIDPDVRVYVLQYRPVYITGEVKHPGDYPYVPGLTVQKAVTLAGGFTALASKRNLYLVPEGDDNDQRQNVNLDASVGPGDTIIVEEGLF